MSPFNAPILSLQKKPLELPVLDQITLPEGQWSAFPGPVPFAPRVVQPECLAHLQGQCPALICDPTWPGRAPFGQLNHQR